VNPLLQSGLIRPQSSGAVERWIHRSLWGLLLVLWTAVVAREFPAVAVAVDLQWPAAALLVAAALVTGSTLALQVSLPSAFMAFAVIGLLGGSAQWISHVTGVPFGPVQFPYAYGSTPVQEWFFVPALIWSLLVLNARGVARILLEPLCKHRNHGLHLLALSTLLVVVMVMALEPFATTAHRYWLWGDTRLPVTWQGVPLSCLFASGVVCIITSVAATPFLIDKHPRPGPPASDPAWLWGLMGVLFATGTAFRELWPAATLAGLNSFIALGALLAAWRRRTRIAADLSRQAT
jgi:hypothetical protein